MGKIWQAIKRYLADDPVRDDIEVTPPPAENHWVHDVPTTPVVKLHETPQEAEALDKAAADDFAAYKAERPKRKVATRLKAIVKRKAKAKPRKRGV